MVQIKRRFHPVGQGAFYSETFCCEGRVEFCVVYDCGVLRGRKNHEHGAAVVRKWVAGIPGIDYLFISHFDYDHVSLLTVLRDAKIPIKKVIMPLLTDEDRAFMVKLYGEMYRDEDLSVCRQLLESPNEFFPASRIVRVRCDDRGVDGGLREEIHTVDSEETEAPSGTQFSVAQGIAERYEVNWGYCPWNVHREENRDEFLRLFAKEFGGVQFEDLSNQFPALMSLADEDGGFRRIKFLYSKLKGGINANSLIVYSGPLMPHTCGVIEVKLSQPKFPNSDITSKGSACVYTGDSDLKIADIKDYYRTLWSNVGTIQIPHHGSQYSFCEKPFRDGGYLCVMSCSNKHYFGHPHAHVVNKLIMTQNTPLCVTETCPVSEDILVHTGNCICS